jgi:phosphoglycolate phosphatase
MGIAQKALPKAILFDFDGTLGDSYPAITASINHVRAAHGLPPMEEAEVRRYVGRGAAYLLQHTVPGGDTLHDQALYRAHHPSVMEKGTRLLPGAAEALAALQASGVPVAVCSNKPRDFTRDLLAYLGIARFIAVMLGPEDVSRPKPAPDMVRAALDRLGVAPAEALYIGDMTVDIDTARAAGVPVWVVPTGSDGLAALQAARPNRILSGLQELPAVLGLAGPAT